MKYRLDIYCETGSEGICWCYYECDKNWQHKLKDNYRSYSYQHQLKRGTKITILNEDNTVYWRGEVPYSWTNFDKFNEKESKTITYEKWKTAFDNEMKVEIE